MLYRLISTLGLLFAAQFAAGQTLSGTVIQSESKEPLPGAHLTCTCGDAEAHAASDPTGNFTLALPGELPCTLRATFIGTTPTTRTITDLSPIQIELKSDVSAIDAVVVSAVPIT